MCPFHLYCIKSHNSLYLTHVILFYQLDIIIPYIIYFTNIVFFTICLIDSNIGLLIVILIILVVFRVIVIGVSIANKYILIYSL